MDGSASATRHPAFTLVEIILVILVLAIAAAIIIPNIGSTVASQASSAARVLACDLQAARSLALTTQEPHSVVFRADRGAYKVVPNYDGELYGSAQAAAHPVKQGQDFEVVLAELSGMGSVVVTDVDFDGDYCVTFDAQGEPFNALGEPLASSSVMIRAGPSRMCVSVKALTGMVRVERVDD